MAFITLNGTRSPSSISAKMFRFLKNVGNSIIQAQEARARQYVKKYLPNGYESE